MSHPFTPQSEHADSFLVVGVGASAGGLEAFTRLVKALPPAPGMALLLVQHLDPTHASMLADMLGRETSLPVLQAADGMSVEKDHVYVIPPDTRMTVVDGLICLNPRGDRNVMHMPIDHLFRSLAATYGPRSVAIVLSGNGTDGTLGIADVRDAGGMAFAQDEASAAFAGMPASAASAAVSVDAVLPPEEIAAALVRLTASLAPESEAGESLSPLFAALRVRSGIDFAAYKPSTIRRRVNRRMTTRGFAKVDELVQAVRDDISEATILTRDLLIGVTRFFRDPEVFERLARTALPGLITERATVDAGLRVWVPGCSTGEEAYSIAIAIIEALGDRAESIPVKILATDVNEESLARARTGLYPENVAVDISPERLRRFFRKADGGYRVSPAVRDLCVFARHDLATDPPFARMDLISCRNVLIYFDAGLQRRVIPLFHYAIRPGGYLLLGPAETVGTFTDLFTSADSEIRLYRRTLSAGNPLPSSTGIRFGTVPTIPLTPSHPQQPVGGLVEIQREADRLLSRYAPAGVVVDDNLTILQFRGETDPFLRHPHGTAGLELLRMAREGLLSDLRDGVAEARAKNAIVRREEVQVRDDNNSSRKVNLQIMPLNGGGDLRCFLVLFEAASSEASATKIRLAESTEADESTVQIAQLRRELEVSREHQQAITEEYEATNEELKSANEEILASNEELQSTNEELQTAKEELQSTNEELRTVNEEQAHRNRELERLNRDLHSLLVGVNVPVVVVGRDLLIRRLTSQAEIMFGLSSAEIGRPLKDACLGIGVPELAITVAKVIDTLQATAFEAQSRNGHWYSFRVRPYETEDYRIDGAVITVVDIDALKSAESVRHDLELKMFQAQKLESLGVMAGGIAHDLNNLLTPVLGYCDLAKSVLSVESPAMNYLGEIDRSTRLAADLVMQILAYSGKSRRELKVVDLSDFVRSHSGLLIRAVSNKAELRLDLATSPLLLEVDPAQLSQVILNLVTNAAESITQGKGTVTVRTTSLFADRTSLVSPYLDASELTEGRYAVLEVADTGSGISEETMTRLFDPFYTTKFTGRGLGLAAVLGIIRGHLGTIRVLSQLGLGSTFRVLLPITESPLISDTATVAKSDDWHGNGRVLVVDDAEPVRQLLTVLLRRMGFEVLQTADGNAAIRVFREHVSEVRAVLLDLTMPEKSGLEVFTELRLIRPDVPILVISGFSEEQASAELGGLKVTGFIHKPFTPGAIRSALKAAISNAV
jgi:two-component system, chemotaxis family, CheB/CheR fusion protein